VRKSDIEVKSFCSLKSRGAGRDDIVLHLNTKNVSKLIKQLKGQGLKVEERAHIT